MKMGRREIFSWGGGYLENEEKRESEGSSSLSPRVIPRWLFSFFLCGPLEGREIFKIIIFLVLGKIFTCLPAGYSLLLFGSFGVVQFEIFIILTYVFVRKILTFLLAGPPPFVY